MHVKQRDSIKYNVQALSGGYEFDLSGYLIVNVEKVIYISIGN